MNTALIISQHRGHRSTRAQRDKNREENKNNRDIGNMIENITNNYRKRIVKGGAIFIPN